MGKLKIFEISFANCSGVFYSGNFVDGHVTVELSEPMGLNGIMLTFKGLASVYWSSGSGSSKRSYSDKEKYFEENVRLFGYCPGKSELPPGHHSFPFRFQLPQGLPSSFEAPEGNGKVRYHVACKIDRPWKFDHKTKRLFTVISILDLNTSPESYLASLTTNNQKHLCCLCCKSGEITAQFSIDRTGWVPGEAIRLYADIRNGSSRSMNKSSVILKMITTFYANKSERKSTKVVACVTRPSIEGYGEDTWRDEQLVIPPLPPSFLVGCRIIDIQYIIQLSVDPSGPAGDLEMPLPIIIGTIPLMSVVQQAPPMAPQASNYGQSGAGVVFYPASPTQDLPPPSYMECITGRVEARDDDDNEHTRGNLSFAPAYTYYNWGHTPGALPGT